MTPLAPHLTAFFQQWLPLDRGVSGHTIETYAHTFKLLLNYASQHLKVPPSKLQLKQIDAAMVADFLNYLEGTRGNRPTSRNVRLAAIKSFMHFLEHRVPSAIEQLQRVLAIPLKRAEVRLVTHLTVDEMQAILDAPSAITGIPFVTAPWCISASPGDCAYPSWLACNSPT